MSPETVRESLGLNIGQMADLCGVHRDTYSQWERGRFNPPASARQLLNIVLWLHQKNLLDELRERLKEPNTGA